MIKVLLLKNGTVLITEIEEVTAELGEPDCKLINPVVLHTTDDKFTIEEGKVTLTRWLSSFTHDNTFMISSDKIITLAEIAPQILEKYLGLVNKTK